VADTLNCVNATDCGPETQKLLDAVTGWVGTTGSKGGAMPAGVSGAHELSATIRDDVDTSRSQFIRTSVTAAFVTQLSGVVNDNSRGSTY